MQNKESNKDLFQQQIPENTSLSHVTDTTKRELNSIQTIQSNIHPVSTLLTLPTKSFQQHVPQKLTSQTLDQSHQPPQQPQQPNSLDSQFKSMDSIKDEKKSKKRKRKSKSKPGKRRKIKIEFIKKKNTRLTTFHKRKEGILKKAYELGTLTGSEILLLIMSETGQVYTFTTKKMKPIISGVHGKSLLEDCLNTPDLEDAKIIPPEGIDEIDDDDDDDDEFDCDE